MGIPCGVRLYATPPAKQDQEELESYENNKKTIQCLGPFAASKQRYGCSITRGSGKTG